MNLQTTNAKEDRGQAELITFDKNFVQRMQKTDIKNREDIDVLMRHFYDKLLNDDDMSPIFEKVLAKGLDHHFDILVDFWDNILFYTGAYKRNAMLKHIELNEWFPLQKVHFEKWLGFFNASVEECFEGEKATLAKNRAAQIATLMEMKILGGSLL